MIYTPMRHAYAGRICTRLEHGRTDGRTNGEPHHLSIESSPSCNAGAHTKFCPPRFSAEASR